MNARIANKISKQVISDEQIGFEYKSMYYLHEMFNDFILTKGFVDTSQISRTTSRWMASEEFMTIIYNNNWTNDFLLWMLEVELKNQSTDKHDYKEKYKKILESWNFLLSPTHKIEMIDNHFKIMGGNFKEPIEQKLKKENQIAFFMPFSEEHNSKWEKFKNKLESENFSIKRVDNIIVDGYITDAIYDLINTSKLNIFDITNLNANVLFELGYAIGRSAPIFIIMCSNEKIPFNLSNYQVHKFNSNVPEEYQGIIHKILEKIKYDEN